MTDQSSHNLGGLDIGTALSSQGASRTCRADATRARRHIMTSNLLQDSRIRSVAWRDLTRLVWWQIVEELTLS